MSSYTKLASTLAILALALPAICQAQDTATAYAEITALKKSGHTSSTLNNCDQIIKFLSSKNSLAAAQFEHMLSFFYALKDAKGGILVNILSDHDKITDPKKKKNFADNYPRTDICWSTAWPTLAYTENEEAQLIEFITSQKAMQRANGIPDSKIRVYLRGDKNAPWERTSGAIRAAAASGVSNIIFATSPS